MKTNWGRASPFELGDWKVLLMPRSHTASHTAHICKAMLCQKACGDARPVPASADCNEGPVYRQQVEFARQVAEHDVLRPRCAPLSIPDPF